MKRQTSVGEIVMSLGDSIILQWDIWSVFLFCATIFFLLIFWWRRGYHNTSISRQPPPPGPKSWPVVGCLPNVAVGFYRSGKRLPAYLADCLARQYGPVFRVNLCGTNIIVLSDYNSIKQAFQHPNLNDRPIDNLRIKSLFGGDGIGIASGEIWKRQRRFTLKTFRSLGLGKSSFEDLIVRECHELTKELLRGDAQSFSPKDVFPNASANIICSFAFGRRYDYTDQKFKFLLNIIEQIDQRIREIAGAQIFIPFFSYIPTKRMRELHRNIKSLVEFIDRIVVEHEAVFNPESPNDYIDIFLKEIQTSQDGLLTLGNLRGTVTGLFFAGSGTTSNTMRWAVYCMLTHPEVQMAVQAELDAVVGANRLPTLADKKLLPYTMATLLEIQRFGSTARFGVGHTAAEDTELFGYQISKGSYLIPNLWAVNHDPDIWNDPEEFQPGRFLNEDGQVEQPKEFIPFSIGRRVCLGEAVAKTQLFILFSHLLHQFTFVFPEGALPLHSVDGAKPIPDFLARAIAR